MVYYYLINKFFESSLFKLMTPYNNYGGQVPQTGLGSTQAVAPEAKAPGDEGIKLTHHPLRS